MSPQRWARRYATEVLNHLDPEQVVHDLVAMSEDVPLLLCAEGPPGDDPRWCHRGLVSAWLHDLLGLAVTELFHEDEGFGWSHPKLPAELRLGRELINAQ
jgi:hypothetical protein